MAVVLLGGCVGLQLGASAPRAVHSAAPLRHAPLLMEGSFHTVIVESSSEPPKVATMPAPTATTGLDADMGTDYYASQCVEEEECETPGDDEFTVAILGDLHLDPRKMDDYYAGREHFIPILEDAESRGVSVGLVSLGDLGESKSVRPSETQELFAGTTECHELAADFLSSFGVDYEVIGGNHDLEGIDEFPTDEGNLEAFCRIHGKDRMQFARKIAEKTLLVGLGSTVFRTAKYTSHEVTVDDAQLQWFEDLVASHPAEEGWKLFVFTHAPPIGSGLRVLQENHVVNGCCWLNHSGGKTTTRFIELVRKHRCIKAWFSGHFHLGQDYEDSITFPTVPREVGPYPNRGSCVFAQTSVMRSGTSRDGRQQSRLLRGNKDGFEICTVNHAKGGAVRLDATITYTDTNHEVGVYAHEHAELKENNNFIRVYSPTHGDECYVSYDDDAGADIDPVDGCSVDGDTIAWWHMTCGRVLGVYDGRLIEYDPSTLAPLGLVVGQDELKGKRVVVVGSGLESCDVVSAVSKAQGMEGADCADNDGEEQAVMLVDEESGVVTVVQPNEDGSYWRKIVRNKMIRMKEKRRIQAAERFAEEVFADKAPPDDEAFGKVVSSWGPYTSIVGTATKTGVAGLTAKAKLTAQTGWEALTPKSKQGAWSSAGAELAAAFSKLDDDGDGVLTTPELEKAILAVSPGTEASRIAEMIQLADADGDGKVTLSEFVMLMLFQQPRRELTAG